MSFIKAFVSKHIQAAATMRPTDMEGVAVFFYGAAPAPEAIAALASGAEVKPTVEGGKTRINISWPDVSTMITIDPNWDKATQMEGMRGWTDRFPQRVRELPEVRALIESFNSVHACYGTVTRPALDAENKVLDLFRAMLGADGGFFFSRNSFYGVDGLRITGVDEDPAWLGGPPQS